MIKSRDTHCLEDIVPDCSGVFSEQAQNIVIRECRSGVGQDEWGSPQKATITGLSEISPRVDLGSPSKGQDDTLVGG